MSGAGGWGDGGRISFLHVVSMTALSSPPASQALIHRLLRDKCQRFRVSLETKG